MWPAPSGWHGAHPCHLRAQCHAPGSLAPPVARRRLRCSVLPTHGACCWQSAGQHCSRAPASPCPGRALPGLACAARPVGWRVRPPAGGRCRGCSGALRASAHPRLKAAKSCNVVPHIVYCIQHSEESSMQYQTYPGRPFRLPKERPQFLASFWPPRTAARIWSCSYQEALRRMYRSPDECAFVRVRRARGTVEWVYCVIADTQKRPEV